MVIYSSMGIFLLPLLSRPRQGGASAERLRGRTEIKIAFLLVTGKRKREESAASSLFCLGDAAGEKGRRISSRSRILWRLGREAMASMRMVGDRREQVQSIQFLYKDKDPGNIRVI